MLSSSVLGDLSDRGVAADESARPQDVANRPWKKGVAGLVTRRGCGLRTHTSARRPRAPPGPAFVSRTPRNSLAERYTP